MVAFEKAPPEAKQLLTVPIRELGLRTVVTDTIMAGDAGRARLAAEVLAAARGG